MLGLCGGARRLPLLAVAMTMASVMASGMAAAPAGAAVARTDAQGPAKPPGISCKGFTIQRNDGSGVTTLYRFTGVRAVRVSCDTVRRVLRDDLTGSGRPLGPSASVDGWTVGFSAGATGSRGRAQFHAAYTVAALG